MQMIRHDDSRLETDALLTFQPVEAGQDAIGGFRSDEDLLSLTGSGSQQVILTLTGKPARAELRGFPLF